MSGADAGASIPPGVSPVHAGPEARSSDDHQVLELEGDERGRAKALVEEAMSAIARRDAELCHLQDRLERLLLDAPPVALIDRNGIVRAWSRALERLTSTSAAKVLGRRLDPKEAGRLIDGGRWPAGDGQVWRARTQARDRWQLVILEPEQRDEADSRRPGPE